MSKRLIPASTARRSIATDSFSGTGSAKQSVPKQSGETFTPVLPKSRYSILSLPLDTVIPLPPGIPVRRRPESPQVSRMIIIVNIKEDV